MNYKLRYSSTRAEIWQWYWRSWKKSLWRIHVFFSVMAGFMLSGASFDSVKPMSWFAYTLAAFPFMVAAFTAFPQIMFKPQERMLEVSSDGWKSQVGKMSGSRKWSKVASVEDTAGLVLIKGKNGNVLIVPLRAFESSAQREQFVKDAKSWHRTNG